MNQYKNDVVNSIAQRLSLLQGRMVFREEQAEIAREMVAKNLFDMPQLVEMIKLVRADDNKQIDCPVDYARFCVAWISQLPGSAATLLEIGVDKTLAWYVRQEAFRCLSALSAKDLLSAKQWQEVTEVVESKRTTGEIRKAAIWALVDVGVIESLPALQKILTREQGQPSSPKKDDLQEEWYGGRQILLLALAALGDNQRIPYLIELLYSASYYREREAKQAFAQLSKRLGGAHGIATTLLQQSDIDFDSDNSWTQLANHSNPAVVRWAIQNTPVESDSYFDMLISQLANSDWGIREQASKLVAQAWKTDKQIDQQPIWDLLSDNNANRVTRSWAAHTLLKLDNSIDEMLPVETRQQSKELWQVPWPFECEPAIRHAVLTEYGMARQPGTDVRYQLEFAMIERYSPQQAQADRELLVDALKEADLLITKVQECGEHHQQGSGTFWVVGLGTQMDSSEVYVSTLGRIASYTSVARHKTKTSSGSSWTIGQNVNGLKKASQQSEKQRFEEIANRLGFLTPEKELLENIVPGLNVYFFGHREPLALKDLIYYWQD